MGTHSLLDRHGGRWLYLLMALPITLYVLVVFVWPLVYGLGISLFEYRLTDPTQTRTFVGLDNYAKAFNDPSSRTALVNTLVFVVGAVALELVVGLGLALLLWRDTRLNQIASALLLIPIALTPLVAGLVWRAILNADFGTLGYYITTVLGVRRGLTAQPDTAMLSIILVDAWQWTPLVMLILLAGLKTLPTQPFEAARVDGGSAWRILRHLTLPMLAPTILLALLIRTMDAFKVFDAVFAMTQGGPGLSTTVLNFYVYKQGLVFFDMGYAASLSTILLAVIGVFSFIYIRLIGRQQRARAQRPAEGA
ncbi:MAG: sugar ABC transporter permease [Solirubrobacterales bacterium]|nr:sugar ABC transporter permease [Solirubrobacterales bacterium]